MFKENLVSHFPVRTYYSINYLSETTMNLTNYRSATVKHNSIHNINFAHTKQVYVYTDFIKPDLVGNSYVRVLTSLHFPSDTVYHRFYYAF